MRNARWFALVLLLLAGPIGAAAPIKQIQFEPGRSGTVIRGAVIRGERDLYGLDARQGQRLELSISSTEANAAFQVYDPGARVEPDGSSVDVKGESLPGAGEGDDATHWAGVLRRSGRYLLVVGPTRGNATYRVEIQIR